MKRWRSPASGAEDGQRGALRRSSHEVLALGLAVGVVILGAACERVRVDGDPGREGGASAISATSTSATSTKVEFPAAGDPETREEVVAWIDDEPVPIAEARSLLRGDGGRDAAQRRMAVEGAISRRLVARAERADQAAREEESPGARHAQASRRKDPVADADALFQRLRDGLSISEDELRAHYEETRWRYLARQVRLRRQVYAIGTPAAQPAPAHTAEAAETAEASVRRLDPRHSEVIGPAPLSDLPRSLLPEVLELQTVGERIVIERADEGGGGGGATLVELVEILPAKPLSFERVREQVEASLRTLRGQQAMRTRLADLRAASAITIEEATLTDDGLWETAGASPRAPTSSPHSSASAPSPSAS